MTWGRWAGLALAVLLSVSAGAVAACKTDVRNGLSPDQLRTVCGEPKYAVSFMDLVVDASLRTISPPVRPITALLPEPFQMGRVPKAVEDLSEILDELRWELYQLRVELTRARLASFGVYAEVWDYPAEGCTIAIMGKSVASGLRVTKYTCGPEPLPDDEISARQRAYKLLFGVEP